MSPEQRTKLVQHIEGTWANKVCWQCQRPPKWVVDGVVTLMLSDDPHRVAIGGQIQPCASVVCGHCGNTLLVNLIVAGVLKGDPQPPAAVETAPKGSLDPSGKP